MAFKLSQQQKPKIKKDDFVSYVNNNPNATSEDIGKAFNISASGARYWLRKLGYSYKKKPLHTCKLAGKKIIKDRGWGKRGEKLSSKKSGKYYERTNILAGYVNKKSIAPMVFNGSCTTELFNSWVENFLIKELQSGQFVVMDNASFHKSAKTKELIESVECKLIFLPPYSPDFNPIEKFWANMKRWIKQRIEVYSSLYNVISAFFLCVQFNCFYCILIPNWGNYVYYRKDLGSRTKLFL
tara:strand:+ start:305 stop:1024 length:720 start_codon:yes stop_codon:yes gene_type:complete